MVVASNCVVPFVQKLPCAVKNGLAGSNRPQITLPHMQSRIGIALAVPFDLPVRIPRAKLVLRLHELLREPARLEVRIILPFPQADADRVAAGLLVKESRGRADQVARAGAFIHQAEELDRDFSFVHSRSRFACWWLFRAARRRRRCSL